MLHSIENPYMKVTAAEHGAELMSILGADGTEYLWQGDPAYWCDRAPNLFPYVARLTEGSYYLDGKLYHMNIHGIALYRDFRLVENTGTAMTFELTDDEESYAQYPRHFAFRITYSLEEERLDITFRVDNRDEKTMYFGIGGHPGFNVPLAGNGTFRDWRIRFTENCNPVRVGFTPACYLSGQDEDYPLRDGCILPFSHDMFDEDAIVLKEMSRQVVLESDTDSHSLTVTFPEMPVLAFWHMPKTDAPYVCIEPWSSLPSRQDVVEEFSCKSDLVQLEAGKTYETLWSITMI